MAESGDGRAGVLLLSGGLDSTALAWWQRPQVALHIDYGQRAAAGERRAASAVARAAGFELETIDADLSAMAAVQVAADDRPAPTRWPYRNQLILTIAAAWAATRAIRTVQIGTVANDGGQNTDGSEAFMTAVDSLCAMQEFGIRIEAPVAHLTTVELIRASAVPDDLLGWTHSCFVSAHACGTCPGCEKRSLQLRAARRLHYTNEDESWPNP